ncbi:phosphotransferase [Lysinibacillus sp. GbtcB16]|uniref:phosphotransferase n=1 Tax=Lysinibacillus sp. GbtcB16 TaxID=2824761 RepID=UPI001C311938|nr:phosphotransferase [Lysinibacillus sp. GbtcB16]
MLNNIDTAIILAYRCSDTLPIPPYLLQVNHQTLIKRTIGILKNNNINNIFVVVGYKKNLIMEELKNENVNYILNPEYTYTGTMKPLSLLKNLIDKDFLLIEGNLLFEEKLIDILLDSPNPNCISCSNLCESGEETFVEYTEKNRLINISKNIRQLNALSSKIMGISRISIGLFRGMLEKCNTIGDYLLNYEYLMLKCSELYPIYCVNIDSTPSFNICSYEQYMEAIEIIQPTKYCEINSQTVQFISDYLYRTLETPLEMIKLVELSGGMTNNNYKITLKDGNELQMRIPGAGTNNLVNRNNEIINSKAIEALKINVPIFYFNIHDGVKISKYIKYAETLSKRTAGHMENMESISSILNKLHTSKVKMNNNFSFINLIRNYESVIISKTDQHYLDNKYPNFAKQKEKIEYLNHKIQQLESFYLCPCHNDLVPENFIKSRDGEIFLIDWEYSGYNNPLWDLAAFILESELMDFEEQLFLKLYFQRPILDEEYFQINFYKAAQDILWSLWTIVKELHGDSFGNYGYNRYIRGCNLLNGGIAVESYTI